MKGFLTGIGLGAVIGILLAPENGTETRKKLITRAAELANSFEKRVEEKSEGLGGAVHAQTGAENNEVDSEVSPDPVAQVLNTASKTQLRKVPGIGDARARRIIENRPFESEAEAVENKVIPETVLKSLKDKLVDTDEGVA